MSTIQTCCLILGPVAVLASFEGTNKILRIIGGHRDMTNAQIQRALSAMLLIAIAILSFGLAAAIYFVSPTALSGDELANGVVEIRQFWHQAILLIALTIAFFAASQGTWYIASLRRSLVRIS